MVTWVPYHEEVKDFKKRVYMNLEVDNIESPDPQLQWRGDFMTVTLHGDKIVVWVSANFGGRR